jgi:hypothetical protein
MAVEIDLDKTANGWVGSISIPAQNASGLPLEAITFTNGKCAFRIKGAPGEPTLSGTLSADGKTLSGDFTQGGGAIPFSVSRVGEAKVEEIKKSSPVAKAFLGTWEGTLEAGQTSHSLAGVARSCPSPAEVIAETRARGSILPCIGIPTWSYPQAHLPCQANSFAL